MSTTVRVSERTRQRVAALAAATGRRMQQVVDDAIVAYERELFWRQLVSGYEGLAENPKAWEEVHAERTAEAPSLDDDMSAEDMPDDDVFADDPPAPA